jgi:hypothetical protein
MPNADWVYLICGITFLFLGIIILYVATMIKEKEREKDENNRN